MSSSGAASVPGTAAAAVASAAAAAGAGAAAGAAEELVRTEVHENGVCVVTMLSPNGARREVREHRFNDAMLTAMHAALDKVLASRDDNSDGPGVTALVITNEVPPAPNKPVFSGGLDAESTGLDPANVPPEGPPPAFRQLVADFYGLLLRLANFPAATVCCIRGSAVAGGFLLAAMCDIRIMMDDYAAGTPEGGEKGQRFVMWMPEVPYGLGLSDGFQAVSESVLPDGAQARRDVLLFGKRLSAKASAKYGLVDGVGQGPDATLKLACAAAERLLPLGSARPGKALGISRSRQKGAARLEADLVRGKDGKVTARL